MDGHDHSSIKLFHRSSNSLRQVERTRRDGALFADIVQALTIEDEAFGAWCDSLAKRNNALLPKTVRSNSKKHGFQNTVVRVEDQYGVGVEDFLLEFYEKDDDEEIVAETFHTSAIRGVHKYSDDASFRSVYIDCTRLRETIDKVGEFLSVSVTAYPEMSEKTPAGSRLSEATVSAASASNTTTSTSSLFLTARRLSPCSLRDSNWIELSASTNPDIHKFELM